MKKLLSVVLLSSMLFWSCGPFPDQNQTSTSGAKQTQVGSLYKIPTNSKGLTVEQDQIMKRIEVTNDPTKVLWIHIIAPMTGKLITRIPVRSKITSSGKRLEPVTATYEQGQMPKGPQGYETNELLQPDGTYGSSDSYQYWFDPMGRYHQMGTAGGLGYLLTDYPIDLNDPQDEITGLYNAHLAAYNWQKAQEEILKKQQKK